MMPFGMWLQVRLPAARWALLLLFMVSCGLPRTGWSRSATMLVVRENQPVPPQLAEMRGWSASVLALINHRLRTIGWFHTFSTEPPTQTHFAFTARAAGDVQEIIKAFAEARGTTILLDPRSEPATNFATPLKPGSQVAAVASIDSQKMLDEWYLSLPQDADGRRKSGKVIYERVPTALPPMLTLYVGHAAVDLKQLQVPPQVHVLSLVTETYRQTHPDAPVVPQILQFVATHKARQDAVKK